MSNERPQQVPPANLCRVFARLLGVLPDLPSFASSCCSPCRPASLPLSQGLGTIPLPYNLFVVDQRLPGIFKLHMLASGGAMLLIPLVIALRRTSAWHRPLGYVTAVAVVLGGLTSLPVALYSHSVVMARAGFFAQGVVWLALIALGIIAMRQRRFGDHARLMLAMAAVASGALWVRLTTTIATGYDLPFDPVYGCAAWLGWLVPLAVVTLLPTPYAPFRR